MHIIKKNSSSPFHLQRSIVDQSEGSYQQGGFDPNNAYSDSGYSEGIAAFGKILGAGLSSVTKEDVNNRNIAKKDRLTKKEARLTTDKKVERAGRVHKRLEKTKVEIKTYNDYNKPVLTSDIDNKLDKSKEEEKSPLEQTQKPRSEMTRAELVAMTKINRENIVRKKDSIVARNANAKGMTRDEYKSWGVENKKKPNAELEGKNSVEFTSTTCGVSKQHAKDDKKEWSKKQ